MVGLLLLLMAVQGGLGGRCPSHGTHPCTCSMLDDQSLEIDCDSRKLTTMPDMSVFKGQPIHFLTLAQNDISVLPHHFLDGLVFQSSFPRQDAYIDLSGNPISNISPEAFLGLQADSLGLRLQSCSLHQLPSLALGKMANWTFLFLNDNQISSIEGDAFQGLQKLRHVVLNGNPIKHLHKDTFLDQKHVMKTLQLSNMQLNALPVDVLTGLSRLQTLELDDNQITTLPANGFAKFHASGHMTIYLRRNHLNSIPRDTFAGVSFKLKHLRLDENNLRQLDFLQDYCSEVFSAHPSITVNDNQIMCNCMLYDVIRSDKVNIDGACSSPAEYYGIDLGSEFLEFASGQCSQVPQQPCTEVSAGHSLVCGYFHVCYALFTVIMFLFSFFTTYLPAT